MAQAAILGSLLRRGRELLPRIALVGGIQLANVILAYLVLPAQYGAIALVSFVVKNCHQGTLGLTQGYLYGHYNSEESRSGSYAGAYLILGSLYYGVAAIVMDAPLLLYCLPFVLLFAMEPFMRTRRDFSAILVPEFIFLTAVILAILLDGEQVEEVSLTAIGLFCILLAGLYLVVVLGRHIPPFLEEVRASRFAFSDVGRIIRNGMPAYLSTLLAFLLLVVDRQFILRFYGDDALGVFMLAFQACLVISIVSSLLNATSIVDVGSLLKHDIGVLARHMRKRYFATLGVNMALWFVTIGILALFANVLFPEFQGVTAATAWMGVGIACQGAFYSVSPYLFFKKRQAVVNYVLMGILVLKAGAYYLLAHLGFDWISAVAIQSALLAGGMISCTLYLYFIVTDDPLLRPGNTTQAE